MATRKTTSQARLRLVKSDDLDLCNSYSFTAASPLGSPVRPCSMSLMEEAASPTSAPISDSVMPSPRSSEMREAQVGVAISPSLRRTVELSQRLAVTGFRDNSRMPRPPDMPKNLDTVGARVRWWREKKKFKRPAFAKKVGYSSSGLSDLELGRSNASEKLHLIAAELGLNPHYLETGNGEPEAAFPQEPPPPPNEWPFPAVPLSKLKRLNRVERSFAETSLLEALAVIEAERRNKAG